MGRNSSRDTPAFKRPPVQVFTDGSYWNDKGGYGAVLVFPHNGGKVVKELVSSTSYGNTTHNRMELRPILAVLKRIKTGYRIDIYSDSQYCVDNCKRLDKWEYTGRIKSVKNRDLWLEIHKEIKRHRKAGSVINFSWIRGHAGYEYNELADKLASKARDNFDIVSCQK